jgi:hypothetical protein
VRKGGERVNVGVRDRRGRRRLWSMRAVLPQYWISRPTVNIYVVLSKLMNTSRVIH